MTNITFMGFANNVGDYLALVDLFVFPSLHQGMESTLVDAMGYCLPVVAGRVGGTPDVIQDGETGILVEPADAEALQRAIVELYDDADWRVALGTAARARAAN